MATAPPPRVACYPGSLFPRGAAACHRAAYGVGAAECARARSRGGGLKGAVKVGNWENRLHAWNREKEMHQRAGRGAPVSRMAATGPEAGRRRKLRVVAVQRGQGRCRASPLSARPPLLPLPGQDCLLSPAGSLCNRPGGDPRGAGTFPLPPTSGFPKAPPSLVFHWLEPSPLFPSCVWIGWYFLELRLLGGRTGV